MKPGDNVTFTITSKVGQGYRMTSKQGTIESLNPNGDFALIRYRNGRKVNLPVSKLRSSGQRTELTEAFLNLGKQVNK